MNIEGYWNGHEVNFITTYIKKCSNRAHCKNENGIRNFLKQNRTYFTLYTIQIFTDFDKKYKILRADLKYFEIRLHFDLPKIKNVFYKTANISTDLEILTTMKTNDLLFLDN
jgi:hypothetical protein